MEASDQSPKSRRLFVTDRKTKTQFLVDTGADLCFSSIIYSWTKIEIQLWKVEAILNFRQPETPKQLRRFLGTINFNRLGIPNAAKIQAPLNELLQGNIKGKAPIQWNSEALQAFEECKKSLANAALIAYPAPDAALALFTVASDFAVGAALQQHVDGEWQPLGYFSKKLSSTERKYGAYDR